MPVQPGGPVLVETICRADTHDPQADVDRTVRSVHYAVAVGTVALAIALTRWAVNELAVIPTDRLLAAPATNKWTFRGHEAKASDVAVARLLNDLLGRPEHGLFESYMSRAGITEIPDKK